jgi:hypothetical protein
MIYMNEMIRQDTHHNTPHHKKHTTPHTHRELRLVREAHCERQHVDQRLQLREEGEVVGVLDKHLGVQVPLFSKHTHQHNTHNISNIGIGIGERCIHHKDHTLQHSTLEQLVTV